MEQTKYDVFISYSRKDYVDEHKNVIPGNGVQKVKDVLTQAGISYWFDEEGIYSGEEFTEKIVTNIEAARIFIYLSTANANASPWTSKEIACADEMQKYIIPIRLDRTPYNKKVLFRIADLSYIDYYSNPEKGLHDMVNSVKTYLKQIQAEGKRKKEEEEQKHEELHRIKEQERIVNDITLACTKLNNDERKIELARENLLLDTQKVIDPKQQAELRNFIIESSPIRVKQKKELPPGNTRDDKYIIYLTIEGTQFEEIEVEITDSQKTIRDQVRSIVSIFDLSEKDKEGNPVQYYLAQISDDAQEPEILYFEDEDGRELCLLDYNIYKGDHLHLIPVLKYNKRQFSVIQLLSVTFVIVMSFFCQNVRIDEIGIQLAIAFSLACALALLYLIRLTKTTTTTQWTIIRCIVTAAFIINTTLLPIWNDSITGPYLTLSLFLSILTSFTFLINKTWIQMRQ